MCLKLADSKALFPQHNVLAVGYDTSGSSPYFVIKNRYQPVLLTLTSFDLLTFGLLLEILV